MKKQVFLILGMCLFSSSLLACDLCSIYMNIEPNDLKNSFGFNYRFRNFKHTSIQQLTVESRDKHELGTTVLNTATKQEEQFNSYDLWVNYFVKEKWQIFGNMTFTDNTYLENDSILHNTAGPGDLTIIGKYLLYNSKAIDSSTFTVRVQVGGGLKLPTGTFNKTHVETPSTDYKGGTVYTTPIEELDPHFQAGTGSLDYILLTEFQVRRKQFGLRADVSYRMNGTNRNDFRFANRFNANSHLFYQFKWESLNFIPLIGMNFESSKRDSWKSEEFENSGGSALFLSYGTKIYIKKMAFGASIWDPIRQSLNDNQLQNNMRFTTDLTFYF